MILKRSNTILEKLAGSSSGEGMIGLGLMSGTGQPESLCIVDGSVSHVSKRAYQIEQEASVCQI
jgi:hypothetical protein